MSTPLLIPPLAGEEPKPLGTINFNASAGAPASIAGQCPSERAGRVSSTFGRAGHGPVASLVVPKFGDAKMGRHGPKLKGSTVLPFSGLRAALPTTGR